MTMNIPYIAELYIYPIKSCGAISLQSVKTDKYGLQHDRQWMIINKNNEFLTQRELPILSLIIPSIKDEKLTITLPDTSTQSVPKYAESGTIIKTQVWDDEVLVHDCGDEIASFLSEYCQQNVRLVKIGSLFSREVQSGIIDFTTEVGFADSYPLLLISQLTLDDLNSRLLSPIPMNRFRPNIVINGGSAYQEDHWRKLRTENHTVLHFGKRCSRCVITTIDQSTAISGKEPLKTLASYNRDHRGRVMFGSYWAYQEYGNTLRVGDTVSVIE